MDAQRKKSQNREPSDVEFGDDSLDMLLHHMRRVREAVPVNEQLREELRARLAGLQEKDSGAGGQIAAAGETSSCLATGLMGGRNRRWLLLPAVLLVVAGICLCWSLLAPKSLQVGTSREINRFWQEKEPLEFACVAPEQGYIVVRNGVLQLLDQQGNLMGTTRPPAGQAYGLAAFSPGGGKLALSRRYDTGEEDIVNLPMPPGALAVGSAGQLEAALTEAEVWLTVGQNTQLAELAWSPDGQTLAYVRREAGEQGETSEIYLLTKDKNPLLLCAGERLTWSPDGTRLAVERTGDDGRPELWLTNLEGGGAIFLTAGEQPAWGGQGYLAYVKTITTERVLTYAPDGEPLFTARRDQGEIRTIKLGDNGEQVFKKPDHGVWTSSLLLKAPEADSRTEELNWLRSMELAGVREPRTLLLNEANRFQDICFTSSGENMLIARQDGGTVVLLRVDLQERLTKGVNGHE